MSPLSFVTNTATLFFTAMEVLGAIVWLYFVRNGQPVVGAVVIFVGLAIEHVIEGASLDTGIEDVISALFGSYVDKKEIQGHSENRADI